MLLFAKQNTSGPQHENGTTAGSSVTQRASGGPYKPITNPSVPGPVMQQTTSSVHQGPHTAIINKNVQTMQLPMRGLVRSPQLPVNPVITQYPAHRSNSQGRYIPSQKPTENQVPPRYNGGSYPVVPSIHNRGAVGFGTLPMQQVHTRGPIPANPVMQQVHTRGPAPVNPILQQVHTRGPAPANPALQQMHTRGLAPANPVLQQVHTRSPAPATPVLQQVHNRGPAPANHILQQVHTRGPAPANPVLLTHQTPSLQPFRVSTQAINPSTSPPGFVGTQLQVMHPSIQSLPPGHVRLPQSGPLIITNPSPSIGPVMVPATHQIINAMPNFQMGNSQAQNPVIISTAPPGVPILISETGEVLLIK